MALGQGAINIGRNSWRLALIIAAGISVTLAASITIKDDDDRFFLGSTKVFDLLTCLLRLQGHQLSRVESRSQDPHFPGPARRQLGLWNGACHETSNRKVDINLKTDLEL